MRSSPRIEEVRLIASLFPKVRGEYINYEKKQFKKEKEVI